MKALVEHLDGSKGNIRKIISYRIEDGVITIDVAPSTEPYLPSEKRIYPLHSIRKISFIDED